MPRTKKKKKNENIDNEKYNADNEIIIGVTTKPKENVRVDKKSTRKNSNSNTNAKDNTKRKISKDNPKTKSKIKEKSSKEKDNKKKAIKKKNTKRIIITIFILLILIIGGLIYYLTTPIFNVLHIDISGNNRIPADTYISLSKIIIGETNIFAFTKDSLAKKIKSNAYVDNVEINRKLPNTVEIIIKERNIDYQVKNLDSYIYLNNQGYILENAETPTDAIEIKGLSFTNNNIEVGQRINNEDLMKLDTILKFTNYCKYNGIENKISYIDVSDTNDYIIEFLEDNKTVYLGNASNLSERVLWLKTVLQKEAGHAGEIFINGDLNKDKVFFREKIN